MNANRRYLPKTGSQPEMLSAAVAERIRRAERADELYEVIGGEFVLKQTSAYLAWIWSRLSGSFCEDLSERALGRAYVQMMFRLSESEMYRPDVAYVSDSKWPRERPPPRAGDWMIIPDITVDVVSPEPRDTSFVTKHEKYFEAGVSEVWVVVPQSRRVQVYRAIDDVRTVEADQLLTSDLIPGWSLNVGDLLPHIFPRKEILD